MTTITTTTTSAVQSTPASTVRPTPDQPPKRNGRWSGYRHLLMARMLELRREPEVVFWVFVFPLLLAAGLGIAFRNKPGDATSVAIVAGARSQDAVTMLERSSRHSTIRATVLDRDAALKAFHVG